jgi:hypothetical protein
MMLKIWSEVIFFKCFILTDFVNFGFAGNWEIGGIEEFWNYYIKWKSMRVSC